MNLSELSKSEVAYIETMYRLKETNDAASVSVLVAESVMHQHRIVELYFNTKLGLDSEVSCAEASKVDYLLDNAVVEKMCKALDRTSRCHPWQSYPIQGRLDSLQSAGASCRERWVKNSVE